MDKDLWYKFAQVMSMLEECKKTRGYGNAQQCCLLGPMISYQHECVTWLRDVPPD